MLHITTVTADGSRITTQPRSRFFSGKTVEIAWGAACTQAGGRQAAYRIEWATKDANWDSGWVQDDTQRATLEGGDGWQGQPVHITLAIRDQHGHESAPYTATLYNVDTVWHAPWIGPKNDVPKRTVYLRREFEVAQGLRSAVLYACGIGYHHLMLNGQPLDDAALEPAHTDYTKSCHYVAYPLLADKLTPGTHCLAALVGEGWRRNSMTCKERYPDRPEGIPFAGRPLFTMQMMLTYEDGTTQTIISDSQWQAGTGMLWENDLFNGETWDAARRQIGWNLPGFAGFDEAVELPGPGGRMMPMLIPPIRVGQEVQLLALWQKGDATIIDFGQNLSGVVRLKLPQGMQKGHTIRVRHTEELTEDGDIFPDTLRSAQATDTYIASGDARDLTHWQPLFTYHGFRYVRVEGMHPKRDNIVALWLHTQMDTHSVFRCGDAMVTRIHEACVATERSNQHSILTDCPQRDERMGWMNDATVRFEETPYNFDIGCVFPKVVRDIVDTQDKDGAITCTAPYVLGSRPGDPVSSSFLVAGWQHYLFTGSTNLLKEGLPHYEKWQRLLARKSEDYIVPFSHYGDWAGPADCCVSPEDAHSALTPGIFMSTGYSYYNCMLLARMWDALNNPDNAHQWRERADKIKQAMLAKWYNPDAATMATGSQACQAFALWLGIIPEKDTPRAARIIHEDLMKNGHRITTGNLCTRYLMDVLCDYGYVDDAWRLMTRQVYPSWGYMLQHEATTIWERFELKKNPGMNSHSHPMYGAVDGWLYAYIAGIRPTGPGFATFDVKPYLPTGLLSAQAVVDTVRGDVAVRWTKRYDGAHLQVTVPFGAQAQVHWGGQVHTAEAGFHTFHTDL
ncbi:MAG: family 78 glycoside hydrolase catalytic domain [Christensenellales bacterium]|jgi:alpha-L-rhamnosidase